MTGESVQGQPLRCLFLGYLSRLAEVLADHPRVELLAVGVEPQRERSAGITRLCRERGIETWDARGVRRSDQLARWLSQGVDLIVVGAFGQILSPELISAPRIGVLNAHASLLPEDRGGHPIEAQLLRGARRSGASLHWVVPAVDSGPIAAQREIPLSRSDDYETVFGRFQEEAASLLRELLDRPAGDWPRRPQRGDPGPAAAPLEEADGELDWRLPAARLERRVRALGWRGWCRSRREEGDLVVYRAQAVPAGGPGAPGTVVCSLPVPRVITQQGELELLAWEGTAPVVGGRLLPPLAVAPRPRVAMMQPTLLPWQGLFALMSQADVFVLLDDFQFCRRSYHQRNRLFLAGGTAGWVTVPVAHGGQSPPALNQARIDPAQTWRRKLTAAIKHAYSSCPHAGEILPFLESWIWEDWPHLAAMNEALIRQTAAWLGLQPRFLRSSELRAEGERSQRIASLLQQIGAGTYLAAEGSAGYMAADGVFPLDGVETLFQRYRPIPYDQRRSSEFVSHLSILDALMQQGASATREILARSQQPFVRWDEAVAEAGG